MGRAAALMMGSVLLSRILGYARDAVIAWQHGATPETDAYFVAFTIPDFLNYLLAGGALSITFIPIFARYLAEGKEEEGFRSFSTIATVMGIGMLFFIVLGEFLAGRVIPLLAPGFPPAQAALAARLTRIVLPAQIFFYLGGLLMAVQYARKQFFLPALAPLIYNAGIIAGGLLLGRDRGMEGFAWGVLAGAFLGNFALQIYGARRGGLSFFPRLDFSDPGLKEFIRLSIPIMLGFSLVVVDEWTTRVFGSFLLAGAITWLNNARRLMLVPVGIFGQASGVASYPFLSSLAAEGKKEEMWNTLSLTLRWVFLVSAGVAAIAVVLSREAVLLVYQRGAFTIDDTMRTASALSAFCLGIPFWCAQAIVSRGFFAMRDTWTPTLVGTGAWIVALPAVLPPAAVVRRLRPRARQHGGDPPLRGSALRDPDAADGGAAGSARADRVREAGAGRGARRSGRIPVAGHGFAVPRVGNRVRVDDPAGRRGGGDRRDLLPPRLPVPQRDGPDHPSARGPAPSAGVGSRRGARTETGSHRHEGARRPAAPRAALRNRARCGPHGIDAVRTATSCRP